MVLKKWVKYIQTAGYNGAHILEENPVIELHSGKDMIRMSVNQVMYHFETIQNSV